MGPAPQIARIRVRTPFHVGPTNVYLLRGDAVVLVDAGPNTPDALADLQEGLRQHHVGIEDVELVLLTHQHVDHVGLAGLVAERSGAVVAAAESLVAYFANFPNSVAEERTYQHAIAQLHGAPEEAARRVADRIPAQAKLVAPIEISYPLADGAVVDAGGRRLQALARPGHSPSDTVYVDHQGRCAFVGDHLLAHISSNAIVHRPLTGPADPASRSSSLRAYLASLAATAELDVDVLEPGHGKPIRGHRDLVAERIALHEGRKNEVWALTGDEPVSAFEIAERMWGSVALEQPYLTLSEVLGALDLLVEEGRVELEQRDGAIRYVAAER